MSQTRGTSDSKVSLRPLSILDINERYANWFKDPNLMKFYRGTNRLVEIHDLIDELMKFEEQKDTFVYGIFHNEENVCIGTIKIGPVDFINRISDLVVLIGDKNFHGQGLAVEAIRIGNDLAFRNHGIRKLYGGMFSDNLSSINAYLKAGWVQEGILRGHYLVDGVPMDRVLVACFPESV